MLGAMRPPLPPAAASARLCFTMRALASMAQVLQDSGYSTSSGWPPLPSIVPVRASATATVLMSGVLSQVNQTATSLGCFPGQRVPDAVAYLDQAVARHRRPPLEEEARYRFSSGFTDGRLGAR